MIKEGRVNHVGMVVAYVGVMDEVELIERQIRHLYNIGVGHVVVIDSGSTDGTVEVVRDYAAAGKVTLIDGYRFAIDSAAKLRKQYEASLEEANPDWILIQDADDFIIPRSGDIRQSLAGKSADVVRLERFNVPVIAGKPLWPDEIRPDTFGDLKIFLDAIGGFRKHLKENPETPWIRGKVMQKVAARPSCVKGVKMGGHDIIPVDGVVLEYETADDILVAHVPFSSYDRFQLKVENIRELFSRDAERFGENMGWHWARWLDVLERGELRLEYQKQCITPDELKRLESDGGVVSVEDWFASSREQRVPKPVVQRSI